MSWKDGWNDFKEDNHPFIVGMIVTSIISIALIFLWFLIGFIANILPPINLSTIIIIIIVSIIIYKVGVFVKEH